MTRRLRFESAYGHTFGDGYPDSRKSNGAGDGSLSLRHTRVANGRVPYGKWLDVVPD